MRARELFESGQPWERFRGHRHRCRLTRVDQVDQPDMELIECDAYFGEVLTGKTEVHWGYFVRIVSPAGDFWGKDRRSLYDALQAASKTAEENGFMLLAVGRLPQFKQTGLSANSGFGVHPAFPDRHVHMLELPPPQSEEE